MGKVYDKEYKEAVCKRVVAEGVSMAALSREIGISENTLHTWVRRYRQNSNAPFVGSDHVKPRDAELKRLMREKGLK